MGSFFSLSDTTSAWLSQPGKVTVGQCVFRLCTEVQQHFPLRRGLRIESLPARQQVIPGILLAWNEPPLVTELPLRQYSDLRHCL